LRGCHPELVSGSGFDPLGGDGGPLTGNAVFISVQRFIGSRCSNEFRVHGKRRGTPDERRTWTRSVGTKNRSLTIFYSWACNLELTTCNYSFEGRVHVLGRRTKDGSASSMTAFDVFFRACGLQLGTKNLQLLFPDGGPLTVNVKHKEVHFDLE